MRAVRSAEGEVKEKGEKEPDGGKRGGGGLNSINRMADLLSIADGGDMSRSVKGELESRVHHHGHAGGGAAVAGLSAGGFTA